MRGFRSTWRFGVRASSVKLVPGGGVRAPLLLDAVCASRQARAVGTVVVLATLLRLAALGSGVLLPLLAAPPDRAQQPAPDGTSRRALSCVAFRRPARSTHRGSPGRPAELARRRGRLRGIDSSLLGGPLRVLPPAPRPTSSASRRTRSSVTSPALSTRDSSPRDPDDEGESEQAGEVDDMSLLQ
jgi:hypothetical protein